MTNFGRLTLIAVGALVAAVPLHAQETQVERISAALAAPERSDEDKARDAARRPIEVVQFLGIETGDNVLELIAGGGWYTQVLSAAVGADGQVYAQNPGFLLSRDGFVEREATLHERLGNITAVHVEIADAGLGGQMDAALTALNMHDMYNRSADAAAALVDSVYAALRSGGVFGVIDHRGIAGQPNADLHRMEQQAAEDLLEAAGFVIEETSDLLANPADDHTLHMRDESLGRVTDRFLIRARKP